MKESGLWTTLAVNMRKHPRADVTRVENVVSKGMPDVNICHRGVEAWVELKHEHNFPARMTTVVRFPTYTNEQRLWQRLRMAAGGRVFMLVQVDGEYFLFNCMNTIMNLGITWTAKEMRDMALYHGHRGRVDWDKVLELMCPHPTAYRR